MVYRIEQVRSLRAKVAAVAEAADSIVYYVIEVEHGTSAWSIAKRYSDFHELWSALHAHFAAPPDDDCHAEVATDVVDLDFPKKKMFRSHDLALSRLDALRSYLKLLIIALQDDLCDDDTTCDAATRLRTFLGVDALTDDASMDTLPFEPTKAHFYRAASSCASRTDWSP
ncbi:hypothetical protein SPRG_14735 [Saprolegnia parasitica CBS 223.65]|uniref:PX domain-containing protein n=1 Tax=Saprolegnia parasitica (strain CBS 223.65) TaxID=695850 RepID=A0A067BZ90_SAPPC|nr:hypothetical protein SPRG_14735 [Saprolegnia parasitica CBS 223.65]KDO19892.1 hypothetical protein SPRG_14735 [Saprolegnia parasitica CBS 223.65]|eukprot:XP_012209394.1 hypothetical protein SPRG_14735 [Saprolegnia parasitica CBS 223.65]